MSNGKWQVKIYKIAGYKKIYNNYRDPLLFFNTVLVLFQNAVAAYAVSAFYIPNKIVSGGVSGISTILFYLFGIRPGISFAVINAILLITALLVIGKNFVLKTIPQNTVDVNDQSKIHCGIYFGHLLKYNIC